MEKEMNCSNCKHYVEHKDGIFGGDGLCHFDYKKPKPVRRWFTKCKFYKTKEEL